MSSDCGRTAPIVACDLKAIAAEDRERHGVLAKLLKGSIRQRSEASGWLCIRAE